ncbi:hypothetical protein D3C72_2149390 [compost metagenome]
MAAGCVSSKSRPCIKYPFASAASRGASVMPAPTTVASPGAPAARMPAIAGPENGNVLEAKASPMASRMCRVDLSRTASGRAAGVSACAKRAKASAGLIEGGVSVEA